MESNNEPPTDCDLVMLVACSHPLAKRADKTLTVRVCPTIEMAERFGAYLVDPKALKINLEDVPTFRIAKLIPGMWVARCFNL